jgi:cytochrome P450
VTDRRVSRRAIAKGVVGFGALAAASQFLEACRTRQYGSAIRQGVSDAELTRGTFAEQWLKVAALSKSPSTAQALGFSVLAAAWFRKRPADLIQELRSLGVDVLIGGPLGPIVAVGHTSVTQMLNSPDKLGVSRYEKEMKFLLERYILCDADYKQSHDYEKAIQAKMLGTSDRDLLRGLVGGQILPEIQKELSGKKEVNVVTDVIRKVAVRSCGLYLGVPADLKLSLDPVLVLDCLINYPELKGPMDFSMDEETIYRWASINFQNLFLNLTGDPVVQREGRKYGLQLMAYISKVVDARQKELSINPASAKETMLDRLIKLKQSNKESKFFSSNSIYNDIPVFFKKRNGATASTCQLQPARNDQFVSTSSMFDPESWRIVASLAGAYTGAIATVEEAFTNIVFVLLSNKSNGAYAAAKAAAGADAKSQDFDGLVAICREALRFKPQAEILPRSVTRSSAFEGQTLTYEADAQGNKRIVAKKWDNPVNVGPGALALLSTYGASQDVNTDATLASFDPKRSSEDYFLEFGNTSATFPGGEQSHQCLGKTMALVELAESLGMFLRLGKDHTLVDKEIVFQKDFDGLASPFPAQLKVKIG